MKTIVLDQPGNLTYAETANGLGNANPGEAVVRVHRIGICGTDLHAFEGVQPFFSYPRVLGHELGVEIISVVENAEGLKVGDRCSVEPYLHCGKCVACRRGKTNCCANVRVLGVHADGGMREFLVVPTNKLHRSETLTFDQLALVEPLAIGAHAVARANIEAGEFVLVVGAGPIGLSVVQFLQTSNAKIIVMDINEARLDFARKHFKIAAAIKAGKNSLDELDDLTGGEMPVTVFDATGNRTSMINSFDLVAHGGQLVFVGLFQGDLSFNDPDAHRRELTILCSRNAMGYDFRRVILMLESGEVDIRPWITHRVRFDEVTDQFESWLKPESGFIKALIEL